MITRNSNAIRCEHCDKPLPKRADGWSWMGISRKFFRDGVDNPAVIAAWCPQGRDASVEHVNPTTKELRRLRLQFKLVVARGRTAVPDFPKEHCPEEVTTGVE